MAQIQIRTFYERKFVIIFLPINLTMCFGAQKNHLIEYPQHMFWMRIKENSFPIRTLLWRPGLEGGHCVVSFSKMLYLLLSSGSTIPERAVPPLLKKG